MEDVWIDRYVSIQSTPHHSNSLSSRYLLILIQPMHYTRQPQRLGERSSDDESRLLALLLQHLGNNSATTGSTTGLFVPKSPALVQPFAIDIKWGATNRANRWGSAGVAAVYPPGLHILYGDIEWRANLDIAPLNIRAWCIQERVLAPRTLHFGGR